MTTPLAESAGVGADPEPLAASERLRVLGELTLLWLLTLGAIRLVVGLQPLIPAVGFAGITLGDAVLALVPFLFIYSPVWLCDWRVVDSYAYRLFIPAFSDVSAWGSALWRAARLALLILVPWLVGYHLYQNAVAAFLEAAGPIRSVEGFFRAAQGVIGGEITIGAGRSLWEVLTQTRLPVARLPEDAALLGPYHVFFVAIPEEFFYRGYFQTRLNQVFPRRWRVLGTSVGPGLLIACGFFAFGHSLVTLRWWHFATFFPGLLFGWLRERSGSTLPGALFHAWCNVTVSLLDAAYLIR